MFNADVLFAIAAYKSEPPLAAKWYRLRNPSSEGLNCWLLNTSSSTCIKLPYGDVFLNSCQQVVAAGRDGEGPTPAGRKQAQRQLLASIYLGIEKARIAYNCDYVISRLRNNLSHYPSVPVIDQY